MIVFSYDVFMLFSVREALNSSINTCMQIVSFSATLPKQSTVKAQGRSLVDGDLQPPSSPTTGGGGAGEGLTRDLAGP